METRSFVRCGYYGLEGTGGESGIRTHVRVSPKHAFQACAFSHSAISPATHSLQIASWWEAVAGILDRRLTVPSSSPL
jgi:hypothetical protein